ncbi:MAG: hypothetical protein A2Y38_13900 [Spirochaetes bacterium GWB1_59_5]|nr:MAG: hypothetical protein A2Y38_13900 [Spirochaetes bacterium GWB1_59_5]
MASNETNTQPANADAVDQHRLLDMLVDEVSFVDRGANKRMFLIRKRGNAMEKNDAAAAAEEAAKAAQAAPPPAADKPPEPAKPPADAAPPPGDQPPVLKLVTDSLQRMLTLANHVKQATDSGEMMDGEVPDSINSELAEIAGMLSGASAQEPDKITASADAPTEKQFGDLKMSPQTKMASLGGLTLAMDRLAKCGETIKAGNASAEIVKNELPIFAEIAKYMQTFFKKNAPVVPLTFVPNTTFAVEPVAVEKRGAKVAKKRLEAFMKAGDVIMKAGEMLAEGLKNFQDVMKDAMATDAEEKAVEAADDAGDKKPADAPPPAPEPGKDPMHKDGDPVAVAPPTPPAAAAAPPPAAPVADATVAAITKAMGEQTKALAELTDIAKRQQAEITQLKKAHGGPSAIPVEGSGGRTPAKSVAWQLDMARPITKDGTAKAVSFYDVE